MNSLRIFFKRAGLVLISPGQAFTELAGHVTWRDWVYPLLFVSLVMAVVPAFYRDIRIEEQLVRLDRIESRLADNPNIPPERLEAMQERFAESRSMLEDQLEHPWRLKYLWGYLLIPLFLLFAAAVFAAFLHLTGSFIMGTKAPFQAILAVVLLSTLIGGAGGFFQMPEGIGSLELLVKAPLIIMKGATNVNLGPVLFLDAPRSFWARLLRPMDLFNLWSLVVVGYGFANVYRKSIKSSLVAVFITWLLLDIVRAGVVGFFPWR